MRIYAFKDDKIIHANSEDEAISIYKDIMENRYNGETRSFEELDELATKYYDNKDQNSFYYFSDDELALLWSKCMFTNSHPFGQVYDDEVFDTISSLPNKDEIFAKAEEYADEEEKNFKGKPFFKSESLKESSDENWAVFAKDKSTGKEYCSGVYESKNYAYYWATMDRNADLEYGYGDFEYRVEKVPEYSDELLKSSTELNNLKLANYDKAKEKDDESLKEKVENSYSYKNYVIINDSKANCWKIKDSKDNWIENCFSTDKEAEEFIDDKNESLKEKFFKKKNLIDIKLLQEALTKGVSDEYYEKIINQLVEEAKNDLYQEGENKNNLQSWVNDEEQLWEYVDDLATGKLFSDIKFIWSALYKHFTVPEIEEATQKDIRRFKTNEIDDIDEMLQKEYNEGIYECVDKDLFERIIKIYNININESLKERKGHPKFDAKMWSYEEQEKIQKDVDERNHKAAMNKIKKSSKKQLKENSTDIVYFKEMPDDHYVDVDFLFEDFEENYPGIVITGNDRLKDFGVEQFKEIFEEYDKDEDIISALEEKTGKKYDASTMRGYTQSEWQNVYYPVEEEKYIDELEAYYFGKVEEYIDEEEGVSYLVLDDIAWKGTDAIKKELSEQSGIPVENIKIRKFNGYTRTANYVDEKLNEKSLKEDIETPYFKAYITNLGKYNEGELVGEWVEFPIDEDDFNEVLKKIGVSDEPDAEGNYYEEFFVTDYDCNLNGFNWQDFGEYPSYDTLQEFGELIESIDDVEAVDNAYEVTGDLKEAIDGLEDGSIIYYPGIHSESDLGYEIAEQIYSDGIPKDTLDSYFDYEALGRDLSFDEYETDEEDEDGNTIYVNAGEYWCGDEYASDSDIGYAYVEAVGPDGVANPENYFDYESFGRDLTFGNFTLTSDGAIEYN